MSRSDPASRDGGGKQLVLVFVGVYPPVFESSGPARSVAALVEALGDDLEFHVVTRYMNGRPGLPPDRWVDRGRGRILYVSSWWRLLRWVLFGPRGHRFDVLYLNSVFSRSFTWLPLFAWRIGLIRARRVIVASRGEFSPGALGYGAKQKSLFLRFARRTGVFRSVEWQVSNSHELEDLRRVLGPTAGPVHVAQNITGLRPHEASGPAADALLDRPLRVAFLARISPMKNLDGALKALALCKRPLHMVIAGPISDPAYWERCQEQIQTLPPHVEVEYVGEVPGGEVVEFLATFDVTFLPTRGENHGHTIAESLLGSTPVLISDRTPWSWLADEGAGDVLAPDDSGGFAAALDARAQLTSEDVQRARAAALRIALEHVVGAGVAEHREMLSGSPVVSS